MTHAPKAAPRPGARRLFSLLPWVLVGGWLTLQLVFQLEPEWSLNPQYQYGWAIPFLCAYLLFQRWEDRPPQGEGKQTPRFWITALVLAILAIAPARLLQSSDPDWRITAWLAGLHAVALALILVACIGRGAWLRHFAFPILFFLVAIPWPTGLERGVIQALAEFNARTGAEVISLAGVPAIARGCLIQTPGGWVGIDEACSGIRSVQACLMVGLFFGELYRLGKRRRFILAGGGVAIATLCNLARTLWLASGDALAGPDWVHAWHDPAGLVIMVVCLALVWTAAHLLEQNPEPVPRSQSKRRRPPSKLPLLPGWIVKAGWAAVIWIIAVEATLSAWHHAAADVLVPNPIWSIDPAAFGRRENIRVQEQEVSPAARAILRYDRAWRGRWAEENGETWQVFFARWLPGRSSGFLTLAHNPEICLGAVGMQMREKLPVAWAEVGGLRLPYRPYVFSNGVQSMHVFYLLWDQYRIEGELGRLTDQTAVALADQSRWQRLRSGLFRPRRMGRQVLEMAVIGPQDAAAARAVFIARLAALLSQTPEAVKRL